MKRNLFLIALSIATIILISGCTSIKTGDGLTLGLYADPQTIFGEGITTLHIDIDNRDIKTLNNVVVDAFDTGLLRYIETNSWGQTETLECRKEYADMKPDQFNTFSCALYAPNMTDYKTLQTDINVKATFNTEFSVAQILELITNAEYERQVASNKFSYRPQSYSYRDKYVELQIDFSEQLPIVIREGKKYFIYFTINNIGSGFVSKIMPEDFYLRQNGNLVQCGAQADEFMNIPKTALEPVGKKFPKVACEINMPKNVDYISSYELIIYLKYDYEIRDKTTVNIVR